jgi:predicted DNA-binding transcriptional regulator AlpA
MPKKLFDRVIPDNITDMPPLIEQQLLRRFLGWSPSSFLRRKADPNFPKPCKFSEGRAAIVYYKKSDVIQWWENLNGNKVA